MNVRRSTRGFTHLDDQGRARMVDVSPKRVTRRSAEAVARVEMSPPVLRALRRDGRVPKGDAWAAARLAGVMAAKKTADLIPLCHPLPLDGIDISFDHAPKSVLVRARVRCEAKTGVEMEALTAVSVAALTLYDMCKGLDKGIVIGPIYLLKKSGGRSGDYSRAAPPILKGVP